MIYSKNIRKRTFRIFNFNKSFESYLNSFSASFKISSNSMLLGFPSSSDGKASVYNAGDPGSVPGSGRSSGDGNGNSLQCSCLENPMDGGAWRHSPCSCCTSRWGCKESDGTEQLIHNSVLLCFSKYSPSFQLQFPLKFLVKYNTLDFPTVC